MRCLYVRAYLDADVKYGRLFARGQVCMKQTVHVRVYAHLCLLVYMIQS